MSSSKLLSGFRDALRNRYAVDHSGMSIGDWIVANTTIRGAKFSFDRYRFQKAIADDEHPDLYCEKCSQVGLTETQLRKFMAFLSRYSGTSGLFSLPNGEMYERVWDGRLLPLFDDKVFQPPEGEKWTRRKGMFQLGMSMGYMTDCTEGSATSIPVDFLINDEVDLSPQAMIALFNSRLQNSDHKVKQRFSTATFHDFGVNGGYKLSDQREYFIRCDSCGHHQIPLFTDEFVRIPGHKPTKDFLDYLPEEIAGLSVRDAYVACPKCSARLDLARGQREWVALYPERDLIRGYKVRPFSNDRVSIFDIFSQLAEYRRLDNMRGFVNTVIGDPFTPNNARLKPEQIERCFGEPSSPDVDPRADYYLGGDMGSVCHLVVGTPGPAGPRAVQFVACRRDALKETIENLDATYRFRRGALDRNPYTETVEAIRDWSGGRIMPVEYGSLKAANTRAGFDDDEELNHFVVNRTTMIDAVAARVRGATVLFEGYGQYRATIKTHLQDMVREEVPEKPGNWVKLTGNDHFFHALGYLLFAMRMDAVEDRLAGAYTGTNLLTGRAPATPLAPGLGLAARRKSAGYNPFERT